MKAIRWPWSKKKDEDVPEKKKSSVGINLRNPDQKPAELENDPIGAAMVSIAVDSMNQPIEECPAIFLVCDCGKTHFRHTGYIETITPYVAQDGGKTINESHPVKTCVSCRKSYVNIGPKTYDVTDKIDLNAWEKFEKEAHKSTGPGGQC